MFILALFHTVDLSPLDTSKGREIDVYVYVYVFLFPPLSPKSTLQLVLLEFCRTGAGYHGPQQALCWEQRSNSVGNGRIGPNSSNNPKGKFSFGATAEIEGGIE